MPRKIAFLTASVFCLSMLGSAAFAAAPIISQAPATAQSSDTIILAQTENASADKEKTVKKRHRAVKESADKTETKAKRHYSRKAKEKESATESQKEQPKQVQTQGGGLTQKLRQAANGENCPCTGGNYCIGPRNGHYCYSASGKKRYLKRN